MSPLKNNYLKILVSGLLDIIYSNQEKCTVVKKSNVTNFTAVQKYVCYQDHRFQTCQIYSLQTKCKSNRQAKLMVKFRQIKCYQTNQMYSHPIKCTAFLIHLQFTHQPIPLTLQYHSKLQKIRLYIYIYINSVDICNKMKLE